MLDHSGEGLAKGDGTWGQESRSLRLKIPGHFACTRNQGHPSKVRVWCLRSEIPPLWSYYWSSVSGTAAWPSQEKFGCTTQDAFTVKASTITPGHSRMPSLEFSWGVGLAPVACGTLRVSRTWNSGIACWPRRPPSTWWSPELWWDASGSLEVPQAAGRQVGTEPPFQWGWPWSPAEWGRCAGRSPSHRWTPCCARSREWGWRGAACSSGCWFPLCWLHLVIKDTAGEVSTRTPLSPCQSSPLLSQAEQSRVLQLRGNRQLHSRRLEFRFIVYTLWLPW